MQRCYSRLDADQMLIALSVACRSISASSSSVNPRRSTAATLSSSWRTLDAPISAEVTRSSRSTHASAICASVCPRPAAMSFSARILAERRVREELRRERARPARPRALRNAVEVLVGEHPLRKGRERDAADAELADGIEDVGLDPAVEHRVRGLVDEERRARGPAGSPPPRASSPPSTRRCPRTAPCPHVRPSRARPSSPRAACPGRSGASRRCRRSRAPCGRGSGRGSPAGTCAIPTRRTDRATCRSPPSSRSRARRETGGDPASISAPKLSSAEPYGGP